MSFLSKLKSRVESAIVETKEHILVQDPAISQKRIEICNSCEYIFKPTSTCKKCGCFMDAKVRLAGAKCPLGKW